MKIKDMLIIAAVLLALHLSTSFWHWIILVPMVYFFIYPEKKRHPFFAGAIPVAAVWLISSLWFYFTGAQIITGKIAVTLNAGEPWLLLTATMVIAFIAGGLGGWCGYNLGDITSIKKSEG